MQWGWALRMVPSSLKFFRVKLVSPTLRSSRENTQIPGDHPKLPLATRCFIDLIPPRPLKMKQILIFIAVWNNQNWERLPTSRPLTCLTFPSETFEQEYVKWEPVLRPSPRVDMNFLTSWRREGFFTLAKSSSLELKPCCCGFIQEQPRLMGWEIPPGTF